MKVLTAVEAKKIAVKLGAEITWKREHDWVVVRWNGSVVAQYGIRRSSKPVGHDYIPRQIHVTMAEAVNLAACPLSREDYFALLESRGKLPPRG